MVDDLLRRAEESLDLAVAAIAAARREQPYRVSMVHPLGSVAVDLAKFSVRLLRVRVATANAVAVFVGAFEDAGHGVEVTCKGRK